MLEEQKDIDLAMTLYEDAIKVLVGLVGRFGGADIAEAHAKALLGKAIVSFVKKDYAGVEKICQQVFGLYKQITLKCLLDARDKVQSCSQANHNYNLPFVRQEDMVCPQA